MSGTLRRAGAALAEEAVSRAVELRVVEQTGTVELATDGTLADGLARHLLAGTLKFAAKKSHLSAGVARSATGACSIRVELSQGLLSAAEIDALLQHVGGRPGVQPKGAGTAFGLAVALRLALFLRGSLQVSPEGSPQHVILTAYMPPLTASTS